MFLSDHNHNYRVLSGNSAFHNSVVRAHSLLHRVIGKLLVRRGDSLPRLATRFLRCLATLTAPSQLPFNCRPPNPPNRAVADSPPGAMPFGSASSTRVARLMGEANHGASLAVGSRGHSWKDGFSYCISSCQMSSYKSTPLTTFYLYSPSSCLLRRMTIRPSSKSSQRFRSP